MERSVLVESFASIRATRPYQGDERTDNNRGGGERGVFLKSYSLICFSFCKNCETLE